MDPLGEHIKQFRKSIKAFQEAQFADLIKDKPKFRRPYPGYIGDIPSRARRLNLKCKRKK